MLIYRYLPLLSLEIKARDKKKRYGWIKERLGKENLSISLAEKNIAPTVIISPNTGRIGAIALSGSIPFL